MHITYYDYYIRTSTYLHLCVFFCIVNEDSYPVCYRFGRGSPHAIRELINILELCAEH